VPCLNGGMDTWEFTNGQEATSTLEDTVTEAAEGVPSP
jgi:hypothetical protein